METLIDITRPSSDSQTQRSQQDLPNHFDKPVQAHNKEFVKLVQFIQSQTQNQEASNNASSFLVSNTANSKFIKPTILVQNGVQKPSDRILLVNKTASTDSKKTKSDLKSQLAKSLIRGLNSDTNLKNFQPQQQNEAKKLNNIIQNSKENQVVNEYLKAFSGSFSGIQKNPDMLKLLSDQISILIEQNNVQKIEQEKMIEKQELRNELNIILIQALTQNQNQQNNYQSPQFYSVLNNILVDIQSTGGANMMEHINQLKVVISQQEEQRMIQQMIELHQIQQTIYQDQQPVTSQQTPFMQSSPLTQVQHQIVINNFQQNQLQNQNNGKLADQIVNFMNQQYIIQNQQQQEQNQAAPVVEKRLVDQILNKLSKPAQQISAAQEETQAKIEDQPKNNGSIEIPAKIKDLQAEDTLRTTRTKIQHITRERANTTVSRDHLETEINDSQLMSEANPLTTNSERIRRQILKCPHSDRKHYAKNMCHNCYHRMGKTKKAYACGHPNKSHYSNGMCQNCYLAKYYIKRKNKSPKSETENDSKQNTVIAQKSKKIKK